MLSIACAYQLLNKRINLYKIFHKLNTSHKENYSDKMSANLSEIIVAAAL